MPLFVDQLGRRIQLHSIPKRIVSLVPSQTELLYDLGLEQEVVGITKFCVHPESWFRSKTRVGGTKTVDIGKVRNLQPDLIIANKEENVKDQVEALANEFPVWISDVENLDDALLMMSSAGALTSKEAEADRLITIIKQKFDQLTTTKQQLSVCYLIWKDPYMTVGGDTFINTMLERLGMVNVFKQETRYPQITLEQIKNTGCQLVLLSSEPYPFRQKHADELQGHLPNAKIVLADGEMFSWYGSRLVHAPEYFKRLLTGLSAVVRSDS